MDLVIEADVAALGRLSERLREAGLYVSDAAIREAVESRGIFNAIDPDSGWKVDFILRKDRPFSREEFEARQTISFVGLDLSITRAEDMVVAKLEWAKLSDSERQLRDVAEILDVQGDVLDVEHIERWVDELGLGKQWGMARNLQSP